MSAIMMTASEANRSFSRLLRLAREGTTVTITSHGEPVASFGPVRRVDEDARHRRREERLARLQNLWDESPFTVVSPWSREELYERTKR